MLNKFVVASRLARLSYFVGPVLSSTPTLGWGCVHQHLPSGLSAAVDLEKSLTIEPRHTPLRTTRSQRY